MNEKISYSLCWEDADVLQVLNKDNNRALLVSSGGCLALSSIANNDLNIDAFFLLLLMKIGNFCN